MKNTTKYGLALLIGLVLVGSVSAFGGKLMNSDSRELVRAAVEDNDFGAWKEAIISGLTQENFDNLVKMHSKMSEMKDIKEQMKQAMEDGDYEAWSEAAELASRKIVDEEQFDIMVQRHQTRDFDKGPRSQMGHSKHFGKR